MPLWRDPGDPGDKGMNSARLDFVRRLRTWGPKARNWTSNFNKIVEYAPKQPQAPQRDPRAPQREPKGCQKDAQGSQEGDKGAPKEAKGTKYIFTNSRSTAQAARLVLNLIIRLMGPGPRHTARALGPGSQGPGPQKPSKSTKNAQ